MKQGELFATETTIQHVQSCILFIVLKNNDKVCMAVDVADSICFIDEFKSEANRHAAFSSGMLIMYVGRR